MRIILEGVDGSGKSHLAQQLEKQLGKHLRWAGGPPDSDYIAIHDCTMQLINDDDIYDRVTSISRQCYESVTEPAMMNMYNCFLNLMLKNSVIIYCTADMPETEEGHRNDEHDKYVRDNFHLIKARYEVLMSKIPHITYNFQNDNFDTLLDIIDQIIMRLEKINVSTRDSESLPGNQQG
jgi:hypothetical protein